MFSSGPGGISAIAAALALASCTSNLEVYRYDNPDIRRRQVAQLGERVPDAAERAAVREFLGPRVSTIVRGNANGAVDPGEALLGGGRGACISRDGYFLTARHVVNGHPCFLVENEFTGTPPGAAIPMAEIPRYVRTTILPGRLVWENEELDLAILKFDLRTANHFTKVGAALRPGTLVHCADDAGSALVPSSGDLRQSVGNGSFQTAGEVLSFRAAKTSPEGGFMFTDMVARGGMSGSPVITADGSLAGIVCQVHVHPLLPGRPRTMVSMLEPRKIREIVERDRRERPAGKF